MKMDLFTPSQLPYPGQQTNAAQCGSTPYILPVGAGAYQPPARDGLFNSVFTPDDLPYPLPVIERQGSGSDSCSGSSSSANQGCNCPPPGGNANPSTGTTQPPSSGNSATQPSGQPAQSSSTPPPTQAPGQIIINVGVPSTQQPSSTETQGAAATPTSTPPAASATPAAPAVTPAAGPMIAAAVTRPTPPGTPIVGMPIIGGPPLQRDVFNTVYSYNPRLRARIPRAQEEFLEDLIEENITVKMLTANASPLAFVVPDGCNALDIFVGAIELNPGVGAASDLELVVTTGAHKVTDNGLANLPPLKPGDQIAVTIPWRYASWIELAPEHLRVPVTAHFYTIETA